MTCEEPLTMFEKFIHKSIERSPNLKQTLDESMQCNTNFCFADCWPETDMDKLSKAEGVKNIRIFLAALFERIGLEYYEEYSNNVARDEAFYYSEDGEQFTEKTTDVTPEDETNIWRQKNQNEDIIAGKLIPGKWIIKIPPLQIIKRVTSALEGMQFIFQQLCILLPNLRLSDDPHELDFQDCGIEKVLEVSLWENDENLVGYAMLPNQEVIAEPLCVYCAYESLIDVPVGYGPCENRTMSESKKIDDRILRKCFHDAWQYLEKHAELTTPVKDLIEGEQSCERRYFRCLQNYASKNSIIL